MGVGENTAPPPSPLPKKHEAKELSGGQDEYPTHLRLGRLYVPKQAVRGVSQAVHTG